MRWLPGDTAEANLLHSKTIAGTENGTHIVHAAHIVQYYDELVFLYPLRFFQAGTAQLFHCFLLKHAMTKVFNTVISKQMLLLKIHFM